MIISNKHKFIFFAVPKTGTHAVRFALRPHLGEEDEEQVGLYVKRRLPYPELQKLGHGHVSCEQAKAVLDDTTWDSFFKFAFVRNPFDRFVSYCFFMNRQNRAFAKNPLPQMKAILKKGQVKNHILFRPQSELLCNTDGQLMLDYVGKYEDFQVHFDEICSQIGIPQQGLEHVNASVHNDWQQYYDQELQEQVADLYYNDFETFGYEKEIPGGENTSKIRKEQASIR